MYIFLYYFKKILILKKLNLILNLENLYDIFISMIMNIKKIIYNNNNVPLPINKNLIKN